MIENVYQKVIDEELVCSHLGVTRDTDDYNIVKRKISALINYHIQVATDSKVNGGFFLINKKDFENMIMLVFLSYIETTDKGLSDLLEEGLLQWIKNYKDHLPKW